MPTYTVTDSRTGKSKRVTGDSPPTEAELSEIFSADDPRLGGKPEGAPGSTFMGDAAQSLVAAGKGLVTTATAPIHSPIQTLKGIYDLGEDVLTSGAQRTIQGVKRLVSEGSADELGEAVGSVGGAYVGGRMIPEIPGAMRSVARSTPLQVVKGAVKGGASNIPGVSPFVRGIYRGGKDALTRRAEISGGTLSAPNPQPLRAFAGTVEDELEKALAATPESFKSGGTVKPLRGVKNAPVLNPEARGGMVSTQPDKWGVTKIGTDVDEVMTTARGGSGRGPVVYNDPAALLRAAKESGVPIPLEKFKALMAQINKSKSSAVRATSNRILTPTEERLLEALGGNLR